MKRRSKASARRRSIVDPTLEKPLLHLHAATDIDSFWHAVQQQLKRPSRLVSSASPYSTLRFCLELPDRRGSFLVTFSRVCRSRNISVPTPTENCVGAAVVLARVRTHPRGDGIELKLLLCFPGLVRGGSVRLPTAVLCKGDKCPLTGEPASRCAVSSMLAPFCPKADPQTPVNASANATWQIARRFKSPKKFLGFTGVLLPHSQPMSKTRIILTRRWTTEFVKVLAAKEACKDRTRTIIDILANNIIQRFRIKSGRFIGLFAVSPARKPSSMARLRFVPSVGRCEATRHVQSQKCDKYQIFS